MVNQLDMGILFPATRWEIVEDDETGSKVESHEGQVKGWSIYPDPEFGPNVDEFGFVIHIPREDGKVGGLEIVISESDAHEILHSIQLRKQEDDGRWRDPAGDEEDVEGEG